MTHALGLVVALVGLLALGACAPDVDPRFVDAEHTVATLFRAYAIERVSEADVRLRMQAKASFTLRDEAAFRAAFADHRGPHDDGAAGFVFGRLAAAKEHLEFVHGDDGRVTIVQRGLDAPERPTLAVLVPTDLGVRISLADSVPRETRAALHDVYRRHRAELERRGVRQ